MNARRLLAAGAVVLALAAAGCGSDVSASNTYVDRVNLAQSQFSSSLTRLAREITSSSTTAEDRKTLRGLEAAVATTVKELREIDPPDKVKTQHADLVETVATYGESLSEAERNLSGSDAQTLLAQTRLAADNKRMSTRVTAAISSINQKLQD